MNTCHTWFIFYFWLVFHSASCKCPFSAPLQALQACLQYSPALYSARWSSTSWTKSSRVSSMDKSTYFTVFSSIFLNDHDRWRMIVFRLLVRLSPSSCCSSISRKHAPSPSLPWAPVLRYDKNARSPCVATFEAAALTSMPCNRLAGRSEGQHCAWHGSTGTHLHFGRSGGMPGDRSGDDVRYTQPLIILRSWNLLAMYVRSCMDLLRHLLGGVHYGKNQHQWENNQRLH